MKFDFSIVIPTYNGIKLLPKLFKRLRELSKDYSMELVVIDSSSTDGTAEFLDKQVKIIPNMRVISISKSEFNHGLTRNMGVKLSKGKFVCFLSQDVLPKDNKFLSYYEEDFKRVERPVAVFGKQIPYKNTPFIQKIEINSHFERLDRIVDKKGILIQSKKNPTFNSGAKLFELYALFDPFSCYRRDFLLKNPFLKTEYGEDIEMGTKIIKGGKTKIYDNRAQAYHSNMLSLFGYYLRCRKDIKLWSRMGFIRDKIYIVDKIKAIFNYKMNLLAKIYFTGLILISYLFKTIAYLDIKITGRRW